MWTQQPAFRGHVREGTTAGCGRHSHCALAERCAHSHVQTGIGVAGDRCGREAHVVVDVVRIRATRRDGITGLSTPAWNTPSTCATAPILSALSSTSWPRAWPTSSLDSTKSRAGRACRAAGRRATRVPAAGLTISTPNCVWQREGAGRSRDAIGNMRINHGFKTPMLQ